MPDSADIWTDAGLLSFELLFGDCAIEPAAMSQRVAGKIWHTLRLRVARDAAALYHVAKPRIEPVVLGRGLAPAGERSTHSLRIGIYAACRSVYSGKRDAVDSTCLHEVQPQ